MQSMRRSMHPGWLSNSYVVGDAPGGHAVVVDTGGPAEPILASGAITISSQARATSTAWPGSDSGT